MTDPALVRRILDRLRSVIDLETNIDVIRMRLVEGLDADEAGVVSYTFRPSSYVCPIAVPLALEIKQAVAAVSGVEGQKIRIDGYTMAEQLEILINEEN
ncbi:iron-sulfur cluster assembly protein [Salinispira pacifica]